MFRRRRLHLVLELFRDVLAPPLEEGARFEHARAIVRFADFSDARCRAILDDIVVAMTVVLFRRHTRTAGTQAVFAFEDFQRGAQCAGMRIRPVVARAIILL